jgi:hypothetical protein
MSLHAEAGLPGLSLFLGQMSLKSSALVMAAMLLGTPLCSAADAPRLQSAPADLICKGGQVLGDVETGDLNADGIADAAFLIQCEPEIIGVSTLVVLLGSKGGNYKVLAQTAFDQHERRWDQVTISKGLVIFAQGCAAACNSNWRRSFKFKYQVGQMRLIGQDRIHYGMELDSSAPTTDLSEYVDNNGSSINYLTGTAIHWRESKIRKITVRRTVHFPAGAHVSLEGFDADMTIPGVNGYLDAKFILHLAGNE